MEAQRARLGRGRATEMMPVLARWAGCERLSFIHYLKGTKDRLVPDAVEEFDSPE